MTFTREELTAKKYTDAELKLFKCNQDMYGKWQNSSHCKDAEYIYFPPVGSALL